MPIKKYVASKDTTITDAFKPDLITRAVNANMGASDSLEIFSIFAQATDNSVEKSRILVQFPIEQIIEDRTSSKIPASGSVKFFLKLYNVEHPFSVPRDFSVSINPVSQSWDEGYGLDMETYSDIGWHPVLKGSGCTWEYAQSGTVWSGTGSSYITGSGYDFTQTFSSGLEDIDLDITNLVEDWITSTIPNNGVLVKLSGSFEDGTEGRSFYTKKFSARGSEFFYKRPSIEARWAAVVTDDRTNFFASSSAFDTEDNIMNLYYFNKPRGVLKNIAGDPQLNVKFYSDSTLLNEIAPSYLSISNPSEGIYKARVSLDTTASVGYDVWINSSSLGRYFSSAFDINQPNGYDYDSTPEYVVNIVNLKVNYTGSENARFKIFIRDRDWKPTIYTNATNLVENTISNNLYYKILRLSDNYTIIDYSTGSIAFSKTSYDSNGNYFDLDLTFLEPGYTYGIRLATYDGSQLNEIKNTFKFKVQ